WPWRKMCGRRRQPCDQKIQIGVNTPCDHRHGTEEDDPSNASSRQSKWRVRIRFLRSNRSAMRGEEEKNQAQQKVQIQRDLHILVGGEQQQQPEKTYDGQGQNRPNTPLRQTPRMPGNRGEHVSIGGLHGLFLWHHQISTSQRFRKSLTGFFNLFLPCFILMSDLIATASGPINSPNSKLVLLSYFVPRQEILKIPGGVGGLGFFVDAAAAGGMSKANSFRSVEHQYEDMIAER